MSRPLSVLVPLLVLSGALLVAQEGLDYKGDSGDLRRLPPQTMQKHDFTFVRLMYNGRIPHYLKNWYTDYPTGDQNLVRILRRTTGVDVAPETRVVQIHQA